jgi:hypothetical protein
VAPAPGSSGRPRGDGRSERVAYELFLRGGNAAELFGYPPSGAEVAVHR